MKNKETPLVVPTRQERDGQLQIQKTIKFVKDRVQELYTLMALATSDNERTYIHNQIRDDEKYLRDLQNGK